MRALLGRLCGMMIMATGATYGQVSLAPFPLSLGGNTAAVRDLRGSGLNPAALTGVRSWEVEASAFAEPNRSGGGAFRNLSLGARAGADHVVAFSYAPGAAMEFVFPSGAFLSGGARITSDQRLLYAERFAAGYAFRALPVLSLGAGFRLRSEEVTDTRYELIEEDTTSIIRTEEVTSTAYRLLADLSALWQPADALRVGLVARGLVTPSLSSLPANVEEFALPYDRELDLGLRWDAAEAVSLHAGGTTQGRGNAGFAVRPGGGFELRASLFADADAPRPLAAVGLGAGWTWRFLTVDAGWLRFFEQEGRTGTVAAGDFDPSRIHDVEFNPYTPDRLGLSVKVEFGARAQLARIEGVTLHGGIYPASSDALAYRPIGSARVRNISDQPVYARVRFFVERFMDAPTESLPVHLVPGEEADVPITAVFNEEVKRQSQMTVRDGEVTVSATPAAEFDDRRQTPVVIYGRNDWDGDVQSLRWFVTPADPVVIRTARDILQERTDSLAGIPAGLLPFRKARLILGAFADRVMYVADPRQSADYVQYPAETLERRNGDCDDFTVCFSALLNSIGIATAFVDVIPPGRPDQSHIYLLFDTGLEPQFAEEISSNPKRYVVRRNAAGRETVWIPVESTSIPRGFAAAWSDGAQRYLDDVEIGLGLVKGWVRIVDVH